MNGVRSIFRRKGYLLTALAAAVLLAASSGTAWAQVDATVTITAPRAPVAEGADVVITIRGTAMVTSAQNTAALRTATVELELNDAADDATFELDAGGQVDDATIVSNPEVDLVFAASSSTTGVERTATATVTIRTNHDSDAENEVVSLGLAEVPAPVNVTGAAAVAASFMIDDDETQAYSLTLARGHRQPGSEPRENSVVTGSVMVTVEADPPHYDDGKTLTLHVLDGGGKRARDYAAGEDDGSGVIGPDSAGTVGIGNGDGGEDAATDAENRRTIIVTTPPNDGNRVTDTVVLEAHFGPAGLDAMVGSLDIDVLDIHMLPGADDITAVAKDDEGMEVSEVVEGGDPVFLTITVDRGRGQADDRITMEALTVDIRPANPAQAADYDLSTSKVPLTSQDGMEQSNDIDLEIMLSARSDEDVGDEELVFNLVVSGDPNLKQGTETSTGTFSIAVMDDTMKKVEPKSEDEAYPAIKSAMDAGAGDDGLNPGESFSVMTSDLFMVAAGYAATYGVSIEGGAANVSSTGDGITVTAVEAGESKVTVTATARAASSSFEAEQAVSNVASIAFPVTVVDKALVVTVAADPAEIMEGGTSTITATANRAIQAGDGAVEIGLEVVGDATVEPASITIAAGSMSGSAMLTAAEDDDYADGTVTVVATGSGIDAARQITIAVTDNDEAPVDPAPSNTIVPKAEGDAYPVITGAIEGAAGADGLNPGESFSVPASELFTVTDGYTAGYSASVDGDAATAAVSGDSVTVTAAVAGAAKVTITGTSKMASSSFAPVQVATNVAEITFEVMVVDTALVVTVAADPAEIMEGGTSTITATANRAVEAGDGAVEIGLEVVGDATVDPASITIAAGSMSGSTMLTATEDDDYADETVTVVATGSGIDAARQVTIAVTDNDAAPEPPAALVVTLGMPANVMNGNIVEGESYEITVSADRMVTEDTEVMIMRDRAASDADEDDFTVSSATIMAGYDSATAELMVTEDMVDDAGHADGEALVLFGMVDGEQTNSLTFTIWDTAVPALPLFGQLLLALFLMLGGARLYRRRQQG